MTGVGLDDLYRQVILDHARERHGRGLREGGPATPAAESRQVNPLCGDEVTLRVAVTAGDGAPPVISDVSWTGEGCSISQAATSMLHDLVVGLDADAARVRVRAYREMVRSRGKAVPDEEVLGDAVAFSGVGRHVNRVKCAMLGWTAFEVALEQLVVDEPAVNRTMTSEGER